jgi:hypothetical protein
MSLTPEGSKWIQTTMPCQGKFTNDCGIFMVYLASLYTKGLISHGCFMKDKEVSDFATIMQLLWVWCSMRRAIDRRACVN